MLIIMPLTVAYLLFALSSDSYTYVIAGLMLILISYTLYFRFNRKKVVEEYGQSALGKINASISNLKFQMKLEKQIFYSNFIILIPGIVGAYQREILDSLIFGD